MCKIHCAGRNKAGAKAPPCSVLLLLSHAILSAVKFLDNSTRFAKEIEDCIDSGAKPTFHIAAMIW